MNIRNAQGQATAQAAAQAQAAPANGASAKARIQRANTERASRQRTEPRQQTRNTANGGGAQRDEYVPSANHSIGGAVYTISNVRRGALAKLETNMQVGSVTPSGKTISRKLLEIELPLGKKSLKIYGVK